MEQETGTMAGQAFDAKQSLKSIESNYGPQIAREVVQIFIADYPAKLKKLKAAIEDGNNDIIRFVAHDIKSGCLSMGVEPMSILCEKIEREGSQMPKEDLLGLSTKLSGHYDKISKEFANYLSLQH
jgi:HPt (histidine-containing phosphotransfer) domain-containing protein